MTCCNDSLQSQNGNPIFSLSHLLLNFIESDGLRTYSIISRLSQDGFADSDVDNGLHDDVERIFCLHSRAQNFPTSIFVVRPHTEDAIDS